MTKQLLHQTHPFQALSYGMFYLSVGARERDFASNATAFKRTVRSFVTLLQRRAVQRRHGYGTCRRTHFGRCVESKESNLESAIYYLRRALAMDKVGGTGQYCATCRLRRWWADGSDTRLAAYP